MSSRVCEARTVRLVLSASQRAEKDAARAAVCSGVAVFRIVTVVSTNMHSVVSGKGEGHATTCHENEGGIEVQLHLFCQLGWVVNDTLGTPCTGSWLGPRAALHACGRSHPPVVSGGLCQGAVLRECGFHWPFLNTEFLLLKAVFVL